MSIAALSLGNPGSRAYSSQPQRALVGMTWAEQSRPALQPDEIGSTQTTFERIKPERSNPQCREHAGDGPGEFGVVDAVFAIGGCGERLR